MVYYDGGRGSSLLESVQDVCDQTKTSARLVQHTNGKVHAFDCHQWSMKAASLFRFQQPNAVVCVEQSVASLSGFVLVIEEKKAKYAAYRIFVALAATIFVYFALWLLYTHADGTLSHEQDLKFKTVFYSMLNFCSRGFSYNNFADSSSNSSIDFNSSKNNSSKFRYKDQSANCSQVDGGSGEYCRKK